ncbi:CocE/NonD family hydrolase [Polaromonas sp. YR568]|uniref:CocE/NonD family hydrolase n=1 Tax=Polaromonas sp. YR568 TaxID=1855301 RepID=UPI00398BCA37
MRDGIHLATDVYFPGADGRRMDGKFPVILERTPYGKSVVSRSEKPGAGHEPLSRAEVANFFTSHGYVVIYQDCRGRHGSEGKFTKYLSDADDGYDTCEWIVAQDWCDGNIGTKGLSYAAHTQMALASAGAPGLKAMCVDSGGFSNGYGSGIRQGGAYELKQAAWAVMFAAQTARLSGSSEFQISPQDLDNWFKRMPWRRGDSPLTGSPEYEEFLFDQWEKGVFDDYWKQPGIYAQGFYPLMRDVAALHISSWYDVYPRTAVENFQGMAGGNSPARLILGPWTHGDRWETFAGDVDFGKRAAFEGNVAPGFLEMRLKWFDRWLKKLDNGADHGAPVLIFVMGGGTGKKNRDGRLDHGGKWRAERTWPLPHALPAKFFLHEGGALANEMPVDDAAFREYIFNPLYPVPTLGGAVVSRPPAILAGAYNQVASEKFFGCEPPFAPLSERQDVLVFESEPLAADVEVTGAIEFVLWVSSDCVDTDFTAKLIDVYPPSDDYPDGYAMNLTDGILRVRYRDSWEKPVLMTPGEICRIRIEAFPTSNLFKRGHRIRVDISSSNFPRFDVNPNTGAAEAQSEDLLIAKNRIYLDARHPSHVILPLVPLDADPL